jgi:hypothetical protein
MLTEGGMLRLENDFVAPDFNDGYWHFSSYRFHHPLYGMMDTLGCLIATFL